MDNWVHTTSHSGICHAVHLARTFFPVHVCGQLFSCRFVDLQHIDCSSVHAPSTETDMPHDYKRTCSDHMLENCGSYQILLVNNTHTHKFLGCTKVGATPANSHNDLCQPVHFAGTCDRTDLVVCACGQHTDRCYRLAAAEENMTCSPCGQHAHNRIK